LSCSGRWSWQQLLSSSASDAGRELTEVLRAIQHWGSRWADLTPEQAHPGVVLWMWATFFLDRDRLPRRRVLVRFDYPTLSGPGSRSWLLIERGDAEICEKYPGGEEHLVAVVHDPVAFARWHLGELSWGEALGCRAIDLRGSRTLARALPTWHRDHAHGPVPLHAGEPALDQAAPASTSA
jgi:hypothetical protein